MMNELLGPDGVFVGVFRSLNVEMHSEVSQQLSKK